MKTKLPTTLFLAGATLLFTQCTSVCDCSDMKADRTALSKDGKLKLELSVGATDIKVKMTNMSAGPIVIDNGSSGSGFYYGLGLYDKEGNPLASPDSGYDTDLDVTRLDFGKAFTELAPGESLCRVYRENKYAHQYAHSFGGRVSITRYAFRVPPIKDIRKLVFGYDSCPFDTPINVFANLSNQKVPENFFEGSEVRGFLRQVRS